MSAAEDRLDEEEIEGAATRPPMFLGLPRKLSSLLLGVAALCWILMSGWIHIISSFVAIAMIWGGVLPLVARDYWGFDIFAVWVITAARCLDVREWGGARPASFPLRLKTPYGMASDVD